MNCSNKLICLGICLIFILAFISFNVSASNVDIVFDSSGSMSDSLFWYHIGQLMEKNFTVKDFFYILNQVGNFKPKIEIAREAMISYVNTANPDNQLGFRKFGFGEDEDDAKNCIATESFIPIQALNKQLLIQEINKTQAIGYRTNIGYALNKSAEDFNNVNGEKIIILVSDGEENCQGDPCQVARDLREKGIDVTVHTVGFAISRAGSEELKCISEVTGGTYYDIKKEKDFVNLFAYTLPKTTGINPNVGTAPIEKSLWGKIILILAIILLIPIIALVVIIIVIIKAFSKPKINVVRNIPAKT
jgi:hypothetical protein